MYIQHVYIYIYIVLYIYTLYTYTCIIFIYILSKVANTSANPIIFFPKVTLDLSPSKKLIPFLLALFSFMSLHEFLRYPVSPPTPSCCVGSVGGMMVSNHILAIKEPGTNWYTAGMSIALVSVVFGHKVGSNGKPHAKIQ